MVDHQESQALVEGAPALAHGAMRGGERAGQDRERELFPERRRQADADLQGPAGGGVDIVARLMAEQIGRVQRASVIVENRPGAGTLIATEAVARAAPDGNTVLFLANSFVINAGLRKGAYDPLTSFEPVCLL